VARSAATESEGEMMIRYMPITEDPFKKAIAKNMDEPVWILEKNPPEVPFVKLKISIADKEERFSKGYAENTKEITLFYPQAITKKGVIIGTSET
jgi:hypothetical protein